MYIGNKARKEGKCVEWLGRKLSAFSFHVKVFEYAEDSEEPPGLPKPSEEAKKCLRPIKGLK